MSSLFSLNDDVLRAVLVRTRGSDLLPLCLTCSRFNGIINSAAFRQERCESGAAEIIVKIPSPFELYQLRSSEGGVSRNDEWFQEWYDEFGRRDPVYGYQSNEGLIYVDGKLAGSSTFTLVPRNNRRVNFHAMCDSVSEDLQETGCAFFDRHGRLRLEQIKQAVSTDNMKPFLYVKTFDLYRPEYRTTTATGAKALRKILMDPKLKEKWSVAAYIPDAESQFVGEDRELDMEFSMISVMRAAGDEEVGEVSEDEKNWYKRNEDLRILDMRQFLRAGFQQVKELIVGHNCFFLFAVPTFLKNPMITHEEAMSISIVEMPKPDGEKSDDEKKLLKLMKQYCQQRTQIDDAIWQLSQPKEEQPFYKNLKEKLRNMWTHNQASLDELTARIDEMERSKETEQTLLTSRARGIQQAWSQMSQLINTSDLDSFEEYNTRTNESIRQHMQEADENISSTRESIETIATNMRLQQESAERSFDEIYQQDIDRQLTAQQLKARDLDARVRSEISDIVKRAGVDVIQTSDAIQAAAYNLVPPYIDLLMDFVPQAKKLEVINSLDSHGETPLRTAAMSSAFSRQRPEVRLQTCEKIIELGGDKNLVDYNGLTALGKFRKTDRDMRDVWASSGSTLNFRNPHYVVQVESAPALEALLRPVTGPTTADEAVLDDESDADSDEEMQDENDDEGEIMVAADANEGNDEIDDAEDND